MFSGANLPRVGTYNINVVLGSIQASDGISRVEIAQQTGLTAQTVSVIVRRLIEQGIVEESGSWPSAGETPEDTAHKRHRRLRRGHPFRPPRMSRSSWWT